MRRPSRLHMGFVVVGGTLAILALGGAQVAFPWFFGPLGLVAAILIDLDVFLLFLRRRSARQGLLRRGPRYPLVKFGPVDRRYATRQMDALEKEIAATALVTAVILTVFVASLVLYTTTTDFPVFFAAGLMVLATARLVDGLLFTPLPSESELWDTTDDH